MGFSYSMLLNSKIMIFLIFLSVFQCLILFDRNPTVIKSDQNDYIKKYNIFMSRVILFFLLSSALLSVALCT